MSGEMKYGCGGVLVNFRSVGLVDGLLGIALRRSVVSGARGCADRRERDQRQEQATLEMHGHSLVCLEAIEIVRGTQWPAKNVRQTGEGT